MSKTLNYPDYVYDLQERILRQAGDFVSPSAIDFAFQSVAERFFETEGYRPRFDSAYDMDTLQILAVEHLGFDFDEVWTVPND